MNIKSSKEKFLYELSGNKLKYKRYSKQPLRYPGGKSLAVGEVIRYLPDDLSRVISPFVGGASIEYAIANELNVEVLCYDIFDPLINFYKVLKNNKEKLLSTLKKYELTDLNYRFIKQRLKKSWKEGSENEIEYAADFFFNFGLSYGPGFLGWVSKKYLDPVVYSRMLKKLENANFNNMHFETKSFEKVVPQYKDDFILLDPPYFIGGTSKMFAGIYPQRNFPIYHNSFDHNLLAKQLKNHKKGFLVTYNDCEEIREMYKEFKIIKKEWQYTMGQGETRIGKNRVNNNSLTNIKKSHEIFIIGERK